MPKPKAKRCGGRETTSKRVASVASEVFRKGYATPAEARTLAGSALTQRETKRKPRPRR
jgi:hypothetical protein